MVRPKYPHMRPEETKIMDDFHKMIKFQAEFEYDVHVRDKIMPSPSYMTANEATIWAQQTAKRIDVVIKTTDTIYTAEIKDRNRPSALGQALTYAYLYTKQYAPGLPVKPAIICTLDDPDMHQVCDFYNVRVWVV